MTPTNGFQLVGDIGGPMNLGAEYRWNVPVVTYAFDPSFVNFFGSNGVAAVNSAIQILNNLPAASQLDPGTYPIDTTGVNYQAQAEGLIDLKSETLFLMLQQLGLAQPQRFMFCVHDYSVGGGNNNATIVLRNFDPFSFTYTNGLNGILYFSNLIWQVSNGTRVDNVNITAYPVDPFAPIYTAVAEGAAGTELGLYYTGLTRDDVGGLRYLLQTNNYNFETLLPDVQGAGTNANNYVNLALRGGIDKITFVQATVDALTGEFFSPMTNQFTAIYATNSALVQEQLQRVTTRPDFLFCAGDLEDPNTPYVALSSSAGTTNWINNATLNGNPGGAGPGMIQPPVKIIFNKIGQQFYTSGAISDETAFGQSQRIGSFDGSVNSPISYPVSQPGFGQMSVNMWFERGQYPNGSAHGFQWEPASSTGATFAMETSTNLTDWVTLFTVTNNGSVITYIVNNPASPDRFYRLVPQ
jgi:hypothetical protein